MWKCLDRFPAKWVDSSNIFASILRLVFAWSLTLFNPHKSLFYVLAVFALLSCATTPPAEYVKHPPRSGPVVLPQSSGRPVIAYALGSGAARGFAHVGVLNALDDAGISPDLIVGTSSGSMVGALYASGIRGDALITLALELDRDEVIDYTASRQGVIVGKSLQVFVNGKLGNRLLEELEIPIAVVSTDLRSGTKAVFTHGDPGLAVRAASSFPGLFRPAVIGGREYVDGGVVSPVPVETALNLGADIVIAVDVAKPPSADSIINGWIDVLHQSYLIMARNMSAVEIAKADVVINPDIGDMSLLDFEQRQQAISAGETAARLVISRIKYIIKQKTVESQ
jgi:NTE family protein